jgi:hypothetical protein
VASFGRTIPDCPSNGARLTPVDHSSRNPLGTAASHFTSYLILDAKFLPFSIISGTLGKHLGMYSEALIAGLTVREFLLMNLAFGLLFSGRPQA